jgi:hypothetical protein
MSELGQERRGRFVCFQSRADLATAADGRRVPGSAVSRRAVLEADLSHSITSSSVATRHSGPVHPAKPEDLAGTRVEQR